MLTSKGPAGVQLVEALERSQVRFPMVQLDFFIDIIRPHHGPGLDSVCNRNEYQKYCLGLKAAGA